MRKSCSTKRQAFGPLRLASGHKRFLLAGFTKYNYYRYIKTRLSRYQLFYITESYGCGQGLTDHNINQWM